MKMHTVSPHIGHHLVNEGIQLQHRTLIIWKRQKLHKLIASTETCSTHTHLRYCLYKAFIMNEWNTQATLTTAIRLKVFKGLLTILFVNLWLLIGHFIKPRSNRIAGKPLVFIKPLITQENMSKQWFWSCLRWRKIKE